MKQSYINWGTNPLEETFLFPIDPDVVVSKLIIEIDDKVIEGKIIEKGKAKEKYEDAIASGNSAVLVQEDSERKDVLRMDIGNI